MEEILASIRRIISDEEAVAMPPASARAARPVLVEEPDAARPEAVAPSVDPAQSIGAAQAGAPSAGSFDREDDMAARRIEDDEASVAGRAAEPAPTLPSMRGLDAAAGRAAEPEAPVDEMRLGPLLSGDANAAVSAAFDDLAGALLASRPRTVEDLVKDMLRPMLKGWLDQNLPPLVERLVREEIARVSRGR